MNTGPINCPCCEPFLFGQTQWSDMRQNKRAPGQDTKKLGHLEHQDKCVLERKKYEKIKFKFYLTYLSKCKMKTFKEIAL